jgi:hypothetical protein
VGATDAYLAATSTRRDEIVGLGVFDALPDNSSDATASGAQNLRASLERALATRAPDRMAVQKYGIRRPGAEGGGFEERHWSFLNVPVPGPGGGVELNHPPRRGRDRAGAAARAPTPNSGPPTRRCAGASGASGPWWRRVRTSSTA